MNLYFIAKVAYERQTEDGHKEVTESYIIDALSFTEAEERIIQYLTPYADSGITLKAISARHAEDVITEYSEDGDFWLAALSRSIINERTGHEKKTNATLYLRAGSFEEACDIALSYCERYNADLQKVAKTDLSDYVKPQV